MKKISENTKVTLTFAQLKKLVKESKTMTARVAPKTKKAIADLVKANLPKGWKLDHISDDKRWFFVNVPLAQYFSNYTRDRREMKEGIRKLEMETGFENNGGGCLVGGSRYTLDFYLDIADGSPDTDGDFIPEHIVRKLTK